MDTFFKIEFQFRPVGQGLFYTGVFNHTKSGARYTMAYDCGTKSVHRYIEDEIDLFSSIIKNDDKLDLLIISHFHSDHISHIIELLSNTNGAKLVVLPYLSPDELLLSFCVNSIDGDNPFPDDFYLNPGQFLIDQYNVDNVIYVHGSRDFQDDATEDDINPSKPGLTDNFTFSLRNNLQVLENPPESTSNDNSIFHCYDVGSLVCSNLWCFKFFNKVRNQTQVLAFKTDLSSLLGLKKPSIKDIANFINLNGQAAIDEINKLYEDNFKKSYINDTSLVVLHYPFVPLQYDIKSYILGNPYFPSRCNSSGNNTKRCGNLLVGDLKIDNSALDQICAKWSGRIRLKAVYAQIAHHGAKNYIIPRYFNEFRNSTSHIINYGLGNSNKHPQQSVIDMIQNSGRSNRIYSNTQVNHVKIKYRIESND